MELNSLQKLKKKKKAGDKLFINVFFFLIMHTTLKYVYVTAVAVVLPFGLDMKTFAAAMVSLNVH